MAAPIDPSFAVGGPEWQIDGVGSAGAAGAGDAVQAAEGGGFADLLGSSLKGLTDSQTEAAQASRDLATGQAADPTAVVMAVERAQLSMQLAAQIRTKAVEAVQEILHTPV
jgi:flagellar hook-basal body complex protein FliE